MADDVVNFEVGPKSHLHWVKPVVVNGALEFQVCEPFAPDTIQIFMPGERCDVCPPVDSRPTGTMTITKVDRESGTITCSAASARRPRP